MALEVRSPKAFELLMAAEADPNGCNDETWARSRSMALHDYDREVVLRHLVYLRAIADSIVGWHTNTLPAVAGALDARTVVPGADIDALVKASRCGCHRDWGPSRASGSVHAAQSQ